MEPKRFGCVNDTARRPGAADPPPALPVLMIVQPPPLPRRRFLAASLLALLLTAAPAAPAPAQRAEQRPEQAFAAAYRLYADQLYEQAIDGFGAFRAAYPDHVSAAEALYYQAESSLAVGHTEQAVALFRQFQQRYPAHPMAFQARLALGQYFYQSNAYERAIVTLNDVLADDPPPSIAAKALYWMGESAQNLGRTDEALRYYRQAADGYRFTDTAPIALYAIAYTHVQQDQLDEAARAFELLAARYPDSPYARNIGLALAEVYYELGDYQRVVEEIQRRLPQLEPAARERATFFLAEAYNQLRDSENAIVYYRRFTEGDPASPYHRRALFGLAWNYYEEGVHQWAADHFAQAREGHDDDLAMRATYYEAVNRVLADQKRQAIPLFEAVTAGWPDGPLADHALYEMGTVQYDLRLWSDAHDTYGRLVQAYASSTLLGEALRQRGYTAIALGDFDRAFRDFDRAVALDAAPRELKEEIIFQKAWLLYRTEKYADAAPAFMGLYEQNPAAPKAGEALFWAAESFYQTNQYDRATRLFQQYLKDYPGGGNVDAAHYALGWTYFRRGDYGAAVGAFNTFLKDYRDDAGFVPYRTDAELRLADSYYALKRYPEAIRTYQRLADDGEDYALYQIGQAFNNAGDAFEAINAFRDLLLRSPDSNFREEAQYTLGFLYFQNQDYDQAVAEYRKLIRAYPRDPLAAKAQYGIGDALFNAGRLEEAVQAYTEVLERYPNSPFVSDAAAGIGYALIGMQDDARAEALIDAFVSAHPDSPVVPELRFRQAEVKLRSGRKDAALADFQAFLRAYGASPLAADAYFYLGTLYAERRQPADAEAALRRVVTAYPQSRRRAEAAGVLGRLYLDQGRHAEALEIYRQQERMQAGDARLAAEARYGQSQALLALGRADEAEALLREASRADPDAPESVPARLGLARVYEQSGRTTEALGLYRQVVAASREEAGAEALYHLGNLLLRQGDARAALSELSRMPVLFAGFPDWLAQGYLLQARAFRSLGQTGEASRLYDRVIEEYRGTRYAEQATREKATL